MSDDSQKIAVRIDSIKSILEEVRSLMIGVSEQVESGDWDEASDILEDARFKMQLAADKAATARNHATDLAT